MVMTEEEEELIITETLSDPDDTRTQLSCLTCHQADLMEFGALQGLSLQLKHHEHVVWTEKPSMYHIWKKSCRCGIEGFAWS